MKGGFSILKKKVIDPGLCTRCGGCHASCPVDAISFTRYGIELTGECIECGNCTSICPGRFMDISGHETRLYGRSRNNPLRKPMGIFRNRRHLTSGDRNIYRKGYFGGRVTALLIHALDSRMIDAALLTDWSGTDELSIGKEVTARTVDDVMGCASSKYVFSPVLAGLKEIRDDETIDNAAMVCLPCQIHALRNMELHEGTRDLTEKIRLVVGLNCGAANLDEDGWRRIIRELTGIEHERVGSFRAEKISGTRIRFTINLKDGSVKNIDLPLNRYLSRIYSIGVWERCLLCPDYSGLLSDVTFGMPYIRTAEGERFVESAEKEGKLVRAGFKKRLYQRIVDLVISVRKVGSTRRKIRKKKAKNEPYPVYR